MHPRRLAWNVFNTVLFSTHLSFEGKLCFPSKARDLIYVILSLMWSQDLIIQMHNPIKCSIFGLSNEDWTEIEFLEQVFWLGLEFKIL